MYFMVKRGDKRVKRIKKIGAKVWGELQRKRFITIGAKGKMVSKTCIFFVLRKCFHVSYASLEEKKKV